METEVVMLRLLVHHQAFCKLKSNKLVKHQNNFIPSNLQP